jgi:SAM-dependent methyltransferase
MAICHARRPLPDRGSQLSLMPESLREDADVETSSADYARRFSGDVGRWFLEAQARITVELLDSIPEKGTILDVGGGHAQVTPALVAAGYRVTVVGSHPSCAARLLPWTDAGQCTFEVADLQTLPYGDGSFDAVVCFRLLPHSIDWTRLIGELCRVALHSVVVDYPSTRSVNALSRQFFGLKRRIEQNTRPFALFLPSQIHQAFEAHGFVVGVERPQYLFPMVLHRWADWVALSRLLEAPGRLLGLTRWLGSPIIARADRRAT